MHVETIALKTLKPWPGNPRQGNPDVSDLVASIKAEGLLQPLIVAQNGEGYYVIAGNRRLRALSAIEAEGGYRDAPCHVLPDGYDDNKLLEVALAENAIRLDMHPIDECEAFGKLAADGKDIAGIAAAFNVSERYVRQRMLLAALPDQVRAAYREGKIDHRDAIELARLGDQKLAAKAYKAALKSGTDLSWNARKVAGEDGRFYVKNARFEVPATLKTAEDFFDQDRDGYPLGPYFVDYEKAHKLQAEWLAATVAEVRKAGEHAFVEIGGADDYSRYRRAGDHEKKGVGLVYKVDRSGEIEAVRCVSIAAERNAEKEKAKAKKVKAAVAAGKPAEEAEAAELPYSLKRDIEALRVAALMVAVSGNTALLDTSNILARPPALGATCHQDVRAEVEAIVGDLLAQRDPRGLLALYVEPYKADAAMAKLAEHVDFSEVDWPRSLLARLPRPALELEARALGITSYGAGTKKAELVEMIWKAKPERWSPVFAVP